MEGAVWGLDVSQLRRLKDLELENSRFKKMYADLSLAHEAFRDAVEKMDCDARCSSRAR